MCIKVDRYDVYIHVHPSTPEVFSVMAANCKRDLTPWLKGSSIDPGSSMRACGCLWMFISWRGRLYQVTISSLLTKCTALQQQQVELRNFDSMRVFLCFGGRSWVEEKFSVTSNAILLTRPKKATNVEQVQCWSCVGVECACQCFDYMHGLIYSP